MSVMMLIVVLAGCTLDSDGNASRTVTIGNPTPEDFLANDDADIFMLDDIVFVNAEHIDWVAERDYTVDAKVVEITNKTHKAPDFVHGTASMLPVGTPIYKTDTAIYVAVVEDGEIPYLKMVEG